MTNRSILLLGVAAVAVIIFTIIISISYQTQVILSDKSSSVQSFSQMITVGPVWKADSWTCTSDKDFIVHGALRGLGESQFSINVSDQGTQSLYTFLYDGQPQSFSVGSKADQTITVSRVGTVSGFLTLQTSSDAIASCTENLEQ